MRGAHEKVLACISLVHKMESNSQQAFNCVECDRDFKTKKKFEKTY